MRFVYFWLCPLLYRRRAEFTKIYCQILSAAWYKQRVEHENNFRDIYFADNYTH